MQPVISGSVIRNSHSENFRFAEKANEPYRTGKDDDAALGLAKKQVERDCAGIAYLRCAKLLARVRDEKIYEVLNHEDVIGYAVEHLDLSKASAYRYLQIHDWVKAKHPAWLEKRPKGRIPQLTDVLDLMEIEESLGRPGLSSKKEAAIEVLKEKALDDELRKGNLAAALKGRKAGGIPRMLSFLRAARKEGKRDKDTPADAMELLEKLIGMLESYKVLKVVGLGARSRRADDLLGPILS